MGGKLGPLQGRHLPPPTAPYPSLECCHCQVFSTLKAQGRRIVCYFSAGSYENWRSDWKALKASLPASTFASLLGSPLDGWPGERWLNIKTPAALDIIKSRIMGPRLQRAKARGCDAGV